MRIFRVALFVGFLCGSISFDSVGKVVADEAILVEGQHVVLGDGTTLSPGAVLIEGNRIVAVGANIDAPAASRVQAKWVMPGLVNAAARLGVAGGDSEITAEIAPDFDIRSSIDLTSREFTEAANQGVTTAHILPGSQSVFAGTSCILKTTGQGTSGNTPRLFVERHGLVLALCSDPTSRNQARGRPDSIFMRQPTNRMGVMWILRSTFHRAQQNTDSPGVSPYAMKIIGQAMRQEMPIFTISRTEVDLRSNFELQDEFGVQPILVGGEEAYRTLDVLKERKSRVILSTTAIGADSRSLIGPERTKLRWNVAGLLSQEEIQFCLAGDQLLDQARFAVRYGLDREQAIQSVTAIPAQMLNIQGQVGKIAVGLDADILAFTGDPLEFTSGLEWIMVDGKLSDLGK
ncbi:MAG: amidohydrolase family protein [Pirellula sp.]|nr:amidohydrolase family protein [Pirellula sp.]